MAVEIEGGVGTADFFSVLEQDDFTLRLCFELWGEVGVGEGRKIFEAAVGIAFFQLIDRPLAEAAVAIIEQDRFFHLCLFYGYWRAIERAWSILAMVWASWVW